MGKRVWISLVFAVVLGLGASSPALGIEDQRAASWSITRVAKVFGHRFGGGWHIPHGFGVRIVGLTQEDVATVNRLAAVGLETEVLPARYSRRELLAFYERLNELWDDPALQDVNGFGPSAMSGKLEIEIGSPGVNTVRKLFALFPGEAISVSYEPNEMVLLQSSRGTLRPSLTSIGTILVALAGLLWARTRQPSLADAAASSR